jgi:hypothetical protein
METLTQDLRKKLEESAFSGAVNWDQIPNIQNKEARDFYKERFWQTIQDARTNPFPNSHAAANPDMHGSDADFDVKDVHSRYMAVLPEYKFNSPDDEKYFFGGNPNFGYKLRLNIAIADVIKVSEFLKEKGLTHKFLHGADGVGEVFTVYTGSKDRTDAVAQILSEDLKDELKMPVGGKEVEIAPNVIGYFTSPHNPLGLSKKGIEFARYPTHKKHMRGMPLVSGFENTNMAEKDAYLISFSHLAEIFGTYFYGTKEPNFAELSKMKLSGAFKGQNHD